MIASCVGYTRSSTIVALTIGVVADVRKSYSPISADSSYNANLFPLFSSVWFKKVWRAKRGSFGSVVGPVVGTQSETNAREQP